jgi:dynein heavy chain
MENFKIDLQELSGTLVKTTLLLYNMIQNEMRPTDEKFHYVFSLRDVSRVFQGILLAKSSCF